MHIAAAMSWLGGCILVLVCLAVLCTCCRSNPRRQNLTFKSVEELQLDRSKRKARGLQTSMQRLKRLMKLKEAELQSTQQEQQILTARLEGGGADVEMGEPEHMQRFDARGRAMYGEAWDEGLDNGLPLREVFMMKDEEAANLRRLAAEIIMAGNETKEREARTPRGLPPLATAAATATAATVAPGSSRGAAAPSVPKLDFSRLSGFEEGAAPAPAPVPMTLQLPASRRSSGSSNRSSSKDSRRSGAARSKSRSRRQDSRSTGTSVGMEGSSQDSKSSSKYQRPNRKAGKKGKKAAPEDSTYFIQDD